MQKNTNTETGLLEVCLMFMLGIIIINFLSIPVHRCIIGVSHVVKCFSQCCAVSQGPVRYLFLCLASELF